jgi:hypothetical protein
MTKLPRTLVGAGIVLAGVLATAGTVADAQPVSPVAPGQSFVGMVNGHTTDAAIAVLCPGPLRIGQTGSAAPGQTIGIASPASSAAASGFTGSLAHSIVADLITPAATASPPVVFTVYGTLGIPSSVQFPCTGTSTVVFAPRPTSPTARSARVTVHFVPTCATPVCPALARDQDRRS